MKTLIAIFSLGKKMIYLNVCTEDIGVGALRSKDFMNAHEDYKYEGTVYKEKDSYENTIVYDEWIINFF